MTITLEKKRAFYSEYNNRIYREYPSQMTDRAIREDSSIPIDIIIEYITSYGWKQSDFR